MPSMRAPRSIREGAADHNQAVDDYLAAAQKLDRTRSDDISCPRKFLMFGSGPFATLPLAGADGAYRIDRAPAEILNRVYVDGVHEERVHHIAKSVKA
jgi:hypothetical protein